MVVEYIQLNCIHCAELLYQSKLTNYLSKFDWHINKNFIEYSLFTLNLKSIYMMRVPKSSLVLGIGRMSKYSWKNWDKNYQVV